ncbi:MAG: hypothetical protein WBY94_07125 [Polyangiaceae bacterium]
MMGARRALLFGSVGILSACGGKAFVLAGAGSPVETMDAAAEAMDSAAEAMDGGAETMDGEAEVDSPPATTGVYCGRTMTCDAKPVCCTGATTGTTCAKTPADCSCVTRLTCAEDTGCPAGQPVCCIRSTTDPNCGSAPVFQATCTIACVGGTRLCAPDGSACPGTKTCLTDQTSLGAVGLPYGQGFGICGQ